MIDNSELSPEDDLRLNVLLAQKPLAVRIDESSMLVHALTEKGEARIELCANCEETIYIRRVKAMLSSHVMGSPGGYPVFLKRWTRMGQTRDSILEPLLLLGESEAVVAVAHAPGLTATLAKRVWWVMPDATNARVMLRNSEVAGSDIGRELAAFLLEFLPFEEEPGNMLESVRLVLQDGLIKQEEVQQLWRRAQSKRSMLVGFLHALPDDLPETFQAHPLYESVNGEKDSAISVLARVFSPQGQAFIQTCELALAKVSDQNVAVSLFKAIAGYFRQSKPDIPVYQDVNELETVVNGLEWKNQPELEDYGRSTWFLSAISEDLLNPVFARTDAIGSAMRRKIKPITDRIFHHLEMLKSPGDG